MWYRVADGYSDGVDINLLRRVLEQYGSMAPYWLAAAFDYPPTFNKFKQGPTSEMAKLAKELAPSKNGFTRLRNSLLQLNQLDIFDKAAKIHEEERVNYHPDYKPFGQDFISDSAPARELIDVFSKQFGLRAVPTNMKLMASPNPNVKHNIQIDFMLPCRVLDSMKKDEVTGKVEPVIRTRVILLGEYFGRKDAKYLAGAEFKKGVEAMMATMSRGLGVLFIDSLDPLQIAQQLDVRRVLYDGVFCGTTDSACLAKRTIDRMGLPYQPESLTVSQAATLTNQATKELGVVDGELSKLFRGAQSKGSAGVEQTQKLTDYIAAVYETSERNKFKLFQFYQKTGDADRVISDFQKVQTAYDAQTKVVEPLRKTIDRNLTQSPEFQYGANLVTQVDQDTTGQYETPEGKAQLAKMYATPPPVAPQPVAPVEAPAEEKSPTEAIKK
jgi:hypothetical protein